MTELGTWSPAAGALVIDPNWAAAELLVELLKQVVLGEIHFVSSYGSPETWHCPNPSLIFVDLGEQDLPGVSLIRGIRRSSANHRKVPIIAMASKPTVAAVKMARDAGAHEVMLKPFTVSGLRHRITNVTTMERTWIEASQYVGPDRRRFNSGEPPEGTERRVDRLTPSCHPPSLDMILGLGSKPNQEREVVKYIMIPIL